MIDFNVVWKRIARETVMWSVFFLPLEKRVAIERRFRGKEEFRKLQQADCVIVSFGKSGRTWLRTMLSRFYQLKHQLSGRSFLGFDNFNRSNADIPRIFFTHDNYLKDFTGHTDSKADFYDKKVILMVRDPCDVAVSQFFQWKYRMRPGKKTLNDYPPPGEDVSVFDFVMRTGCGLPKIIGFMNAWADEMPRLNHLLVVRYEDMRANPAAILKQIVDFMGTPGTEEQIQGAVEFASYENMKQLEEKRVFWLAGSRLTPRDKKNPDSFKVRRAKVGGYRDYFQDEELAVIDRAVQATAPVFGYGDAAPARTGQTASV